MASCDKSKRFKTFSLLGLFSISIFGGHNGVILVCYVGIWFGYWFLGLRVQCALGNPPPGLLHTMAALARTRPLVGQVGACAPVRGLDT